MVPGIPVISIGHVLCISDIEEVQEHCALGQIALSDGLYEQAFNHFKNALYGDPNNLIIQKNAWLAKGYFYLSLQLYSGDLDKALACLEKALELDPFDYHIYLGLGGVYFQKQQWMLAMDNFQVVNRAFGYEHVSAIRHLGEIYRKIRSPTQALSFFKKLIALGVEDEAVDQSIAALEREIRQEPNSPRMFRPAFLGGMSSSAPDESHPGWVFTNKN